MPAPVNFQLNETHQKALAQYHIEKNTLDFFLKYPIRARLASTFGTRKKTLDHDFLALLIDHAIVIRKNRHVNPNSALGHEFEKFYDQLKVVFADDPKEAANTVNTAHNEGKRANIDLKDLEDPAKAAARMESFLKIIRNQFRLMNSAGVYHMLRLEDPKEDLIKAHNGFLGQFKHHLNRMGDKHANIGWGRSIENLRKMARERRVEMLAYPETITFDKNLVGNKNEIQKKINEAIQTLWDHFDTGETIKKPDAPVSKKDLKKALDTCKTITKNREGIAKALAEKEAAEKTYLASDKDDRTKAAQDFKEKSLALAALEAQYETLEDLIDSKDDFDTLYKMKDALKDADNVAQENLLRRLTELEYSYKLDQYDAMDSPYHDYGKSLGEGRNETDLWLKRYRAFKIEYITQETDRDLLKQSIQEDTIFIEAKSDNPYDGFTYHICKKKKDSYQKPTESGVLQWDDIYRKDRDSEGKTLLVPQFEEPAKFQDWVRHQIARCSEKSFGRKRTPLITGLSAISSLLVGIGETLVAIGMGITGGALKATLAGMPGILATGFSAFILNTFAPFFYTRDMLRPILKHRDASIRVEMNNKGRRISPLRRSLLKSGYFVSGAAGGTFGFLSLAFATKVFENILKTAVPLILTVTYALFVSIPTMLTLGACSFFYWASLCKESTKRDIKRFYNRYFKISLDAGPKDIGLKTLNIVLFALLVILPLPLLVISGFFTNKSAVQSALQQVFHKLAVNPATIGGLLSGTAEMIMAPMLYASLMSLWKFGVAVVTTPFSFGKKLFTDKHYRAGLKAKFSPAQIGRNLTANYTDTTLNCLDGFGATALVAAAMKNGMSFAVAYGGTTDMSKPSPARDALALLPGPLPEKILLAQTAALANSASNNLQGCYSVFAPADTQAATDNAEIINTSGLKPHAENRVGHAKEWNHFFTEDKQNRYEAGCASHHPLNGFFNPAETPPTTRRGDEDGDDWKPH